MRRFTKAVVALIVAIGLVSSVTTVVASAAGQAGFSAPGIDGDAVESAENATDHPETDLGQGAIDGDSAVVDVEAAADAGSAIGVNRDDFDEYIDAKNERDAAAAPDETFTGQSRDVVNDDGSHTMEVFQEPAYRQEDDGSWVALDPTVVEGGPGSVAATAPETVAPVTFRSTSEDLMSFDVNGSEVSVSAPSLQITEPDVTEGRVTYDEVAPGVDLVYDVTNASVKESLVIDSASAPRSYTFFLSDPDGTLGEATLGMDGTWSFTGPADAAGTGALLLTIPEAVAYEVGHEEETLRPQDPAKPRSASNDVTKVDGGFNVTVTLNDEWAAEHQFPIVLDPTYSWAWGHVGVGTVGADPAVNGWSYVDPSCAQPTTCRQLTTDSALYAGAIPSWNLTKLRSYLRWGYDMEAATHRRDFPGTMLNLPMRAEIDHAGLWLRFNACMQYWTTTTIGNKCPGATDPGIDVYPMTGPWTASSNAAQLMAATGSTPENQDMSVVPTNDSGTPYTPNNWKTVDYGGGQKGASSYYPPNPNPWYSNNTNVGFDAEKWQMLELKNTVTQWVNDPAHAYGLSLRAHNETPQGAATGTGSIWYSSNQPTVDPATGQPSFEQQKKPLLQVVWHPTAPGQARNLTATSSGSTITASFDQSNTGTYAFKYDAYLFLAATGTAVSQCTLDLPAKATPVSPTDRLNCDFPLALPIGKYYVGVTATNMLTTTQPVYTTIDTGLTLPGHVNGLGREAW